MAGITWTGAGLLSFLTIFIAPVLGWIIGWPDAEVALLLRLGALYLVCTALVFAIGLALNSQRGPHGRVWTARHTLDDVPMQRPALTIGGTMGLLCLAGSVGYATGSFPTFVGVGGAVLGVWPGIPALLRAREQIATTQRRTSLTSRGWQVWDGDRQLPHRWQTMQFWSAGRRPGPRPPYQGSAYGVVGGEANGLPFTVFDAVVYSPSALTKRAVTTYAVHLPVVLPSTTAAGDDDGGPPRVRSSTVAFGDALATTDLAADLLAAGFPSWRFEGWDLVGLRAAVPEPPDELAATVDALTAAVARLPRVLLRSYGTLHLHGMTSAGQLLVEGAGGLHRVPPRPTDRER